MAGNDVIDEHKILTTIKKLLGLTKDYTAFDMDIVVHINTVLSNLFQMGIGPEEGFIITGYEQTWDDYLKGTNPASLQQIKTYIYLKVRLVFDPPSNGNLLEAMGKNAKELEYRIYTEKGGY